MKQKTMWALIFAVAFFITASLSVQAEAVNKVGVPTGDQIEVDDVSLKENATLAVAKGSTIDIAIPLVVQDISGDTVGTDSNITISDVSIDVTLKLGDDPIKIGTDNLFNVESGTTYVRTLELEIPDDVDRGTYPLIIFIYYGNNVEVLRQYYLRIEAPKDELAIRDTLFNPSPNVQAGRALLTQVKLKNTGERDQDDVKVTVSIPKLGKSASAFVDDVDEGKSVTSEEIFLRIPVCAEAGDYRVEVEAEYDDGDETVSEIYSLTVVPSGACSISPVIGSKDISLDSTVSVKTVSAGTQAFYQLSLTNRERSAKTFVFSSSAASAGINNVRFDPSNVVTVGAGEVIPVFVVAGIEGNARGIQSFVVIVEDSASSALEQITLSAVVDNGRYDSRGISGGFKDGQDVSRRALEIGLIVLIVIVVLAGIFVALRRRGSEDDGEDAYY